MKILSKFGSQANGRGSSSHRPSHADNILHHSNTVVPEGEWFGSSVYGQHPHITETEVSPEDPPSSDNKVEQHQHLTRNNAETGFFSKIKHKITTKCTLKRARMEERKSPRTKTQPQHQIIDPSPGKSRDKRTPTHPQSSGHDENHDTVIERRSSVHQFQGPYGHANVTFRDPYRPIMRRSVSGIKRTLSKHSDRSFFKLPSHQEAEKTSQEFGNYGANHSQNSFAEPNDSWRYPLTANQAKANPFRDPSPYPSPIDTSSATDHQQRNANPFRDPSPYPNPASTSAGSDHRKGDSNPLLDASPCPSQIDVHKYDSKGSSQQKVRRPSPFSSSSKPTLSTNF